MAHTFTQLYGLYLNLIKLNKTLCNEDLVRYLLF